MKISPRNPRRDITCYVSTICVIFALLCLGCEDERQPPIAPVIANLDVTDITVSSAICTFTIEPVGAAQKAGVIFGTDASLQSETTEASTTNITGGSISLTMSSLQIETIYYYKAYITDKHNSFIYSQISQFETKPLQFDISTTSITASYQADSYRFNITANVPWTITSDKEWCTVQPPSGNGNQEITVTVTENATETPRTATLTIIAGNLSKQIVIEQTIDNTTLDVSVSTINAPYTAGEHSFTITSNAEWTIASDRDWCTVQPTSGNGNQEITVSVTENTTESPRTAALTITAGKISKQVKVEQDIDNTTFEVSMSTINAPYNAGQHSFTITSNADWTITSDRDWCTVQPASGIGNREINVSVTENATEAPRTAILTITAGNRSKQVKVEQDIDNTTFEVSVSTISAPYMAGQHSLYITSNAEWTINTDQIWCTVQPTSGNGDREITITVTENITGSQRTATMTITADNQSKQVTVVQDTKGSTEFGNGIVAAENFGGGDGSEGSPYLIYNARQLKKLVDDVNIGYSLYPSYFKLITDIQVTADEWIPIGFSAEQSGFAAYFDGNGHTISGTLKSDKYNSFGFFGNIYGARVSNLTIAANVINEGSFNSLNAYTGAIVGYSSYSVISSCNITGHVTGGIVTGSANNYVCYTGGIAGYSYGYSELIQNCVVFSNVTGGYTVGSSFTGGIIGFNGYISTCSTSGIITGSGETTSYTGGIAGHGIRISDCTSQAIVKGRETANSAYTGGISGYSSNEIKNCTTSIPGTIIGGRTNISHTGGITGRLSEMNGFITECTNNVAVSGSGRIGGIAGENSGSIHTSLNTGNINGLSFAGGLVGANSAHLYSCCTNRGSVNGQEANDNNQCTGRYVEECTNGHAKR